MIQLSDDDDDDDFSSRPRLPPGKYSAVLVDPPITILVYSPLSAVAAFFLLFK